MKLSDLLADYPYEDIGDLLLAQGKHGVLLLPDRTVVPVEYVAAEPWIEPVYRVVSEAGDTDG